MWVVSSPTKVLTGRKKPFYLNMNAYRNAPYHTLSDAKNDYYELIKPSLVGIPQLVQIRLSYILYTRNAQLCDTTNITSIVNKFFLDSLVKAEIIPDDNYNHVLNTADGFGGIDKNNPRVEIIIEDMTK